MRAFLVLKLPRSGSTLFGRVLNSHPSIICRGEYMRRYGRRSTDEKIAILRTFYFGGPERKATPPSGAFGQTMNPFKYNLTSRHIAAAFGPEWLTPVGRRLTVRVRRLPIRVVVLLRNNALKQAISQASARQRGTYAFSRDEIEDESALHGQWFDVADLVRKTQAIAARSARIRQVARELRADTMHVSYEQLQADPRATLSSVFRFLEVPQAPESFNYTGGYTKVLSNDLRDIVANYEELEKEPTLTPYL